MRIDLTATPRIYQNHIRTSKEPTGWALPLIYTLCRELRTLCIAVGFLVWGLYTGVLTARRPTRFVSLEEKRLRDWKKPLA